MENAEKVQQCPSQVPTGPRGGVQRTQWRRLKSGDTRDPWPSSLMSFWEAANLESLRAHAQ